MSFKARRLSPAALVTSLLIQMHIPGYGYAALGTKIAFTCAHDEHFDICVMDGTGRNEVKLTDDPVRDDQPSWSPDGARIAFRRNLIIYVMDSDGRNLMKLGGGSEPAWSPDGAQIAFTCHPQICVMDADGGNRIQLTEWGRNNDPAWSPDSNRIVFVTARRHGGPEIYTMDTDGGNQLRLTHDLEEKENPAWSPDGEWIAYDSHRNRDFQIYVVRTDGSGVGRRISRERPNNSSPAWSPDGGTIAYVAWDPGISSTIHLMARNGRHLKQLTKARFFSADPDWFDPEVWSVSPASNFVTIWGKIKTPTTGR